MGRRPQATHSTTSQLDAVSETIAEMREQGMIERTDEAVVAAARGLAEQVDESPNVAHLWNEYSRALKMLHEVRDRERDLLGRKLAAFQAELAAM